MASFRTEKDSLGSIKVPSEAYYGAFTQRALENFQISGITEHPVLIVAYAIIKKAAARANMKLGMLDKKRGNAIVWAADQIISGKYQEQFVLDFFQAGAGTPFNMNCNEVIANLASEKLGKKKGNYFVHPNDHVNMGQSSNNVTPTAIKIATLLLIPELIEEIEALKNEFKKKSKEYKDVVKVGRTHLMDAVPISYGQIFNSYASALNRSVENILIASNSLLEIGLGGNAVGTGINTHKNFRKEVALELKKITGLPFRPTRDNIEMTWNLSQFVQFSSSLKEFAIELDKIASDLRLLSSGPKAGFAEIVLPEVEPGSSIMPGKINPSIPEAVNQVCLQVIGNSYVVEEAARAGQLELNFYTPLIAFNLIWSIELLTNTVKMFREKCICRLKVDKKRVRENLEKSFCEATALNPKLGYAKVAEIVKESWKKNKPIREIILEKKLLTKEEVDKILDPKKMISPSK